MKSFSICHEEKLTEELFSRDIVERLKKGFAFLLPYYDYFVTLEGDPDPGNCENGLEKCGKSGYTDSNLFFGKRGGSP